MEVPRKKARHCPGDDTTDAGASAAEQQIAELKAELERCRLEKDAAVSEKIAAEQRHDQVVEDMKGSYSDALEWAYSVESITREHWLAKGHTEEYAGAMGEFLDKFKRIIKGLRMGALSDGSIIVFFDLRDDDGHLVTAPHDDVLMPHWREMANALVHWSEYHADGETVEISIVRIETPDAVLDVLRPAFKRSKVKYVAFVSDGSPKPWKMAEFMEEIIQTNYEVASVALNHVVFSNEEWKSICNAIRVRSAEQSFMKDFGLWNCFVGGMNTALLKDILTSNSNTENIYLHGNGLSSREALIIAEFLATNPSLPHLGLRSNGFDDTVATILANSLSSNTRLEGLYVHGNKIKEEGRLAFLRAIFDVSSLASCAASNHTCQVFGLQPDIADLNCFDEVTYNKWAKIFSMLALSSKDSFINTALLGGVPVSLMPLLLDRANDQDEYDGSQVTDLYLKLTDAKRCRKHDVWDASARTRTLSSVYELVRGCVVPSIYV